MDDFRIDLFTTREKRAAALVVGALVVIGAAAFSFLHPAPVAPARAAAAAAPTRLPPSVLALAPESADTVYAVVGSMASPTRNPADRRLVRSTDAGRTWRTLALPKEAGAPIAVNVVPGASDVVVSTFDRGNGTGTGRLATWRSTDRGDHWTQLTAPGGAGAPRMIDRLHWYAIDASAAGYSVRVTSDAGRTWTSVLALPPPGGELAGVPLPANPAISFSATGPDAFWVSMTQRSGVATVIPGTQPLLFGSRDGGHSWVSIPLDLPAPVEGNGWAATPPAIGPDGRGLILLRELRPGSNPGAAFVTGAAVVTTADGGRTWSPARAIPNHLAVQLGPGDTWWTVEGASLLESRDEGVSWTDVALTMPRDVTLGQLLFVDARTIWSVAQMSGEALRSTDGGRTWKKVPGPAR